MNTNFIQGVLYELKKDYGDLFKYIEIVHAEFQLETGKRDFIKQAYAFTAIILPRRLHRKFIQDIGYLAANKNFTYGALNDYSELKVIIDAQDLPKNLNVDLNGYTIYDHKRYEKVEFEILEHKLAYMLTLRAAESGLPYDISMQKVANSLQLQQGVSYELN